MTTDANHITVSGVQVAVVRKRIKNLHLGVYPPEGRVRVAAPLAMREDAIRVAVVRKLGWIRRQQAVLRRQERQSAREMVSGEAHYFLGRCYRLDIATDGPSGKVSLRRSGIMTLHVRPRWDRDRRMDALYDWYRERLRELAGPLVAKWSRRLEVEPRFWGLKKMKTKWGSCNAAARRVWLNVELAKKPPECLEYLVVHELVHFVAQRHDERFRQLMNKHLPNWRYRRELLNRKPLANERWAY
jgi:predicted metal-dependent hydrolase